MSVTFLTNEDKALLNRSIQQNTDNISKNTGAIATLTEEIVTQQQAFPFSARKHYLQVGYLQSGSMDIGPDSAFHSVYTDMIAVMPGDVFLYQGRGDGNSFAVKWFNSNGETIGFEKKYSPDGYVELTAPDGVEMVMFNSYNNAGQDVVLSVKQKNLGTHVGLSEDIEENRNNTERISNLETDAAMVDADIAKAIAEFVGSRANFDNITDEYSVTEGKYLNNTGYLVDDANGFVSQYISLDSFDELYITANAQYNTCIWHLYTKNESSSLISDAHYGAPGAIPMVCDKHKVTSKELRDRYPEANYVRFGSYKAPLKIYALSEKQSLDDALLKWRGKKWVCVSDSLTEVNGWTTKHYHDYVAEKTGITVVNMGVSGSGYKKKYDTEQAFYQRISAVPTDADVVTIFGSGNDLAFPLGEITDSGTDTLCGCINTTIDTLYRNFPLVRLGIVTPSPWAGYPSTASGNDMELYANAIVEICRRRSIPCLDLYHCSGLRPQDEAFRSVAYTTDSSGVHPSEEGHKILAPRFESFLEQLITY